MQQENLFSHPVVSEPIEHADASTPTQNPVFSDAPQNKDR
jgi:hypothetical protein